jgi:hypothetical protein
MFTLVGLDCRGVGSAMKNSSSTIKILRRTPPQRPNQVTLNAPLVPDR